MKYSFLLILISLGTLYPSNAFALQVDVDFETMYSQFFVAIIAGVLLALAFQIILTALSVALGISMVGNLKQQFVANRVEPSDNSEDREFDQDYNDNGTATGVKVSSAFGLWSTLTTCIALFGASALALNLSFFGSEASNLTVALVIWALFFIILFYLESKIVNTVIGSLVSTATSGLKSSAKMIKDSFTPSKEAKISNLMDKGIEKIRKEFDVTINTSEISDVLDSFLNRVEERTPNYNKLKKDLEQIMKKSKSSNSTGSYMAMQQVLNKAIDDSSDDDNPNSRSKSKQLKQLALELKEAYEKEGSTLDNAKSILTKRTDIEEEEIDKKINQVKDYISKLTPESLKGNNSELDLKEMFSNPSSTMALLSNKFSELDKDEIVRLLNKNTSLEKEKIKNYADKVDGYVSKLKSTARNTSTETIKKDVENTIQNFFNSTNREELNYDELKRDVRMIIDNPKDSLSIIKSRLAKFDKETVRALVTNNKYIDESQIDQVSSQLENTVGEVKDKISKIERKANEQANIIKRKAIITAENTRKTSASAAWWLVITAILSAGASMLGGYVELF